MGIRLMGRSSFIIIMILLYSVLSFPTLEATNSQPSQEIQLTRDMRNWESSNHDFHATSYNPQTQINKSNVGFLNIKWTFPIPSSDEVELGIVNHGDVLGIPRLQRGEGSTTPPLIVDGIVYFVTNYWRAFALDAIDGSLKWTFQVKDDISEKMQTLPLAGSQPHLHAISYQKGWILFHGLACDVYALDAVTGELAWHLEDTCKDIPGNGGLYTAGTGMSWPPVIHEASNTLIYVSGVLDGFTGRGFIAGYDVTDGPTFLQRKWITFTVPPAGPLGTTGRNEWGEWLVDNCQRWWIQGISSCEIPQDLLRDDWGDMSCIPLKYEVANLTSGRCVTKSGSGTIWGQMSVDEETGIVYGALNQPTIGWNATYRPGPNLFSNSIIAISAQSGELLWAHQSVTHDLWDWDCSWNTILGNIGERKVIFKTCKTGVLHAFDASTGELVWYLLAPNSEGKRSAWVPFHSDSKLGSGPLEYSLLGGWDPRDPRTLTRPWQNWPDTGPIWHSPAMGSTDTVWDGRTLYTRFTTGTGFIRITSADMVSSSGRVSLPPPESRPRNTTFYAVDSDTGEVKWSYFHPNLQRTGMVVSGGIAFFANDDGSLYGLDAETGDVIFKRSFGNGLLIPPSIGADKEGNMRIIQIIGGSRTLGGGQPGAVMALGLSETLGTELVPQIASAVALGIGTTIITATILVLVLSYTKSRR